MDGDTRRDTKEEKEKVKATDAPVIVRDIADGPIVLPDTSLHCDRCGGRGAHPIVLCLCDECKHHAERIKGKI